jgi:long-subunit acyl-CoA synthetase (AMP-forming)
MDSALTVGRVLGGMGVKVVDSDTLEEMPTGGHGEIFLREPNICMGYLHNERGNRDTFTSEGWLWTGDLGRIDTQGHVTVEVCERAGCPNVF